MKGKEEIQKAISKSSAKRKKESKKETKEIEELTETLKRVQADFENYKKRVDKEKESSNKYYCGEIVKELLPVIDSFELALKNKENQEDFIKGVELIFSQLHSTLEQLGLRPIKALGEKFDPYKHEVLLSEKSDKEENTILEELQTGYMLDDQIIRHTKVKISKKK